MASHVKLLALFFFPTRIYYLPRGFDINHLSSVLIAVASGSPYTYPTTLGMTNPVMFIVLSRKSI